MGSGLLPKAGTRWRVHQRGKIAGVWTEPGRAKGGDVSTPGCDTEKGVISQKGTRPAGDNKGLLFFTAKSYSYLCHTIFKLSEGFPGGLVVGSPPANAWDKGSIPV